jgi:predicted PurR-regulated permease PerM
MATSKPETALAPPASIPAETVAVTETESAPRVEPEERTTPTRWPSSALWLTVLAGIIVLAMIVLSWSTIFVFAIGLVISFFVLPVVDWLGRRGIGRTAASGIVVLVLVALFALVLLAGLAVLINQGIPFLASIPAYLQQLGERLQSLDLPDWMESSLDTASAVASTAVQTVFDVGAFLLGFFRGILGIFGAILSLMVLPFFLFYLLRDQPKMASEFYEKVPDPWSTHVNVVIRTFKADFADYFKAEVVVGAIMGVIITVGCLVIGAIVGGPIGEFALMLGLIAAVMELLPTIGPIIAMIPALILALGTSPAAFVIVLVFYLVAFQVEGSILVPTIEGKVIEFGPATVLFLIALGFGLGGILGAVIILPVAAIARDLFSYFFDQAQRGTLMAPAPPTPAE